MAPFAIPPFITSSSWLQGQGKRGRQAAEVNTSHLEGLTWASEAEEVPQGGEGRGGEAALHSSTPLKVWAIPDSRCQRDTKKSIWIVVT